MHLCLFTPEENECVDLFPYSAVQMKYLHVLNDATSSVTISAAGTVKILQKKEEMVCNNTKGKNKGRKATGAQLGVYARLPILLQKQIGYHITNWKAYSHCWIGVSECSKTIQYFFFFLRWTMRTCTPHAGVKTESNAPSSPVLSTKCFEQVCRPKITSKASTLWCGFQFYPAMFFVVVSCVRLNFFTCFAKSQRLSFWSHFAVKIILRDNCSTILF